ncbi:DUF6283 family protein [Streptomyces albidoflavus]|uniref:DUF6283 family protein n=1 Tax=Streptomyces albidoflavus TaxID=1886 RepID=UPI0033EC0B1B
MTTLPPARTPCTFCPYRQDVPSGVWAESEYAKLPPYDGETFEQPPRLFQCHVNDRDSDRARVCAGWAGCHDGGQLLGVRVALARGSITPETADAIAAYESPVPLFASGAEAAAHGMSSVLEPGEDARAAITKITTIRSDINHG